MNIKSFTKYALVFLFGAIAATATSAFASNGLEQIKALISKDISIFVNGKETTFDNPVLNYEGRTYLYLRDFEKFGMKIGWDAVKRQIDVNTIETNQDNASGTKQNNISEKKPIYTETLYEWNDIYEIVERPNSIISSVIDGQSIIIYNNLKFISVRNVDYYYDSANNKWYYTDAFLVQFLSQSDLDSLNKYILNEDNRITRI